jgi:hypothetical protein
MGAWLSITFFTYNVKGMKEIIDQLEFTKVESFFVKDTVKAMRRQVMDWHKMFSKDTSDKGPLPKIYKELLKLSNLKKILTF